MNSGGKITIACPNPDCGRTIRVKPNSIGKTGTCPACNQKFKVAKSMVLNVGPKAAAGKGSPATPQTGADWHAKLKSIDDKLTELDIRLKDFGSEFKPEIERLSDALDQLQHRPDPKPKDEDVRPVIEHVVDPKIDALKKLLLDIEEAREELEILARSRRDFIRRYQPGRIEELEQRLREKEAALTSAREETSAHLTRLGTLEIELQRCKAAGSDIDYETLQQRWAQITEEKQRLKARRDLQAENDRLRTDLAELNRLEERYRNAIEESSFDQAIRTRAAELETENSRLHHMLSLADKNRETAVAQARSLRDELERWRPEALDYYKEIQRANTTITELKLVEAKLQMEVEAWQAKEQSLEEQQAAIDAEKRSLENRIEEVARELREHLDAEWASRLAELKARESALEAEIRAYREQTEAEVAREHLQELEQRDQHIHNLEIEVTDYRGLWEATVEKVKAANAAREQWEIETASRHADRQQLEKAIDALKQEQGTIEVTIEDLESKERELGQTLTDLSAQKSQLGAEVDGLKREVERLNREMEDSRRFKHDLEFQTTNRAKRVQSIEQPFFRDTKTASDYRPESESAWLDRLREKLRAADFYFPDRLLNAFHTSIKIADFSQLTVLAGVSGTGKSELPRLYSLLGGIRFLPVAVQPNWDSPQDIFGFYNYLEGRYKATDFLRALVQSQTPHDAGGFQEGLLLVLFDEMNIARPELYFSEMLSKLEMRRGRDGRGDDIQSCVSIDLGALDGEDESYLVQLGRNVVYVGTINEDETTLSLSDKVLDRGNVIVFPRPSKLKSRVMKDLAKFQSEYFLSYEVWHSWIREPESLDDAIRDSVRDRLQQINAALQHVSRAIGHRVLQAIEMYVANHPETQAGVDGWKTAFADQMVQKIMPKLRGIEVQSRDGRDCLEAIHMILKEEELDIQDDFVKAYDAARDGVFMWTSAGYLER